MTRPIHLLFPLFLGSVLFSGCQTPERPAAERTWAPLAEPASTDGRLIEIDETNYQSVVLSGGSTPVLLAFYANWCGHCRDIEPHLRQIAADRSGQLVVARANVDRNRQLAVQHRVRGVPTMKVFLNGRVVDTIKGGVSRETLESRLARWVQ